MPPALVSASKSLEHVQRDFRHINSDDLDLRPVFGRLEGRVKAHVLICMLACYLTWYLRHARTPPTFTDENPPRPAPVAPARRSAAAQAKASAQQDSSGCPCRSFRLPDRLATLTSQLPERLPIAGAGSNAALAPASAIAPIWCR